MLRHYLTELDFGAAENLALLQTAAQLKAERGRHTRRELLGKHVALYFEKPSVRTRISFTVGVHELAGQVVELGMSSTKVGKGEDIEDFGKVLGRFVHAVVARVFSQRDLEKMAAVAGVPVINALSDERHPCQALADLLTVHERLGRIEGVKIAFIGEGNNVATSLALLAAQLGADVTVASPHGYGLPSELTALARGLPGRIAQVEDPRAAASGADVLYTDTWISMGQEAEAAARREAFRGYKIDAEMVASAAEGAIVLHCLPAVRDEEITVDVMYGAQSALWEQAENRLHVQKALLLALMG